jgi:predicted nucleotidyltransferase
MYTEKDFHAIKDIIINKIPETTGVILFGSYAKGTAREESDMDFAILTKRTLERPEKLKALTELRWEIARRGYNADFLVKNEADFLWEKDLPTLSKVIFHEGVEL